MAFSFRQVKVFSGSTAIGDEFDAAFDSDVVAGNHVAVLLLHNSPAFITGLTDDQGNTYTSRIPGGAAHPAAGSSPAAQNYLCYTAPIANSAPLTVTTDFAAGVGNVLVLLEVEGLDPTTPLQDHAGGAYAASNPVLGGSVTGVANSVALAFAYSMFFGTTTWSNLSAGWTEVLDAGVGVFTKPLGAATDELEADASFAPEYSAAYTFVFNAVASEVDSELGGDTVFFSDSFTDTDTTDLQDHAPEIGGAYVRSGGSDGLSIYENRLYHDNTGETFTITRHYAMTPDPTLRPSGTFPADFQADFGNIKRNWTAGAKLGIEFRIQLDGSRYVCYLDNQDSYVRLFKVNAADSYTLLAETPVAMVNTVTQPFRIRVVGSSIKVYMNLFLVISVTDATYGGAGGMALLGASTTTYPTYGLSFAQLAITDPPINPPSIPLLLARHIASFC